jgi:hypothetical protein
MIVFVVRVLEEHVDTISNQGVVPVRHVRLSETYNWSDKPKLYDVVFNYHEHQSKYIKYRSDGVYIVCSTMIDGPDLEL